MEDIDSRIVTISNTRRLWRWIALASALVLLNGSLTFRNVWPTPAIHWSNDLSVELAVCVLLLGLAARRANAVPAWLLSGLAAIWVLLTVGRYADVTAPAIYGREVNIYWDSRHAGAVVAMMAAAVPAWVLVALVVGILIISFVAHRAVRWALGCIAAALRHPQERAALTVVAAAVCLVFAGQHVLAHAPAVPAFATPVTESYAHQAKLFITGFSGTTTIPPARPINADLSGIAGADVFVVFVESYGAVAYDNAAVASVLAPARARLAADIAESHRQVVSGFVTSPTFGGSSWLAHISLLTGVEVRNEDTNVMVMSQSRDTMVSAFKRNGYRTIATMPGNYHPWPEGAFYGFDEIYNRDRMEYRGPQFGWWPVPDQFTLARFDQLELTQPVMQHNRKPVFVLMPTISTHAPFGPTAPYQPDWTRLLSAEPYPADEVKLALATQPDLLNLGPSYANAVSYAYESLGGYLRMRTGRDFVLIVLGDHQPAAAVSGVGASWDVPMHVIASRPGVLARLVAQGFTEGLSPRRAAIGPMNTMLPVLLDAFGGGAVAKGEVQ